MVFVTDISVAVLTSAHNLCEAVLTSIHNLCFEQNKKNKYQNFYLKNFIFWWDFFLVYLNRLVFVMISFYFYFIFNSYKRCNNT